MSHAVLHPRLRAALGTITVDLLRLTARVGDTAVEADSPDALRHALANTVYEKLHAGLAREDTPRLRSLRDTPYEQLLADAVPHTETVLRLPAGQVALAPDPGERVVLLDGVRTLVPATLLTYDGADQAVLRYPCARPALSAGFFLVDGSAGRPPGDRIARFYLHVTDAAAGPRVWGVLLRALEERSIPYQAKVSSSPRLYPRHDAIVVYLAEGDVPALDFPAVVAGLPGMGRTTSVFARELAPGLATASEPFDHRKGMSRMSFGQHRAHALAEGVLEHVRDARTGSAEPAVRRALTRANADPAAPWRNLA
ncbi:T3SS effector HopA1 family protein [Streptomyces afghaniensis]|uniref:T3SS effector HopA1 family protein n=1 Tax=Streptomyces afghaniensis TaxID=66865 RepID=UPI002783A861|nr:T3SS effector HopA1 family protein [Streptomyces afghaniensis]MDQ1018098.1 hypothetical protein [Streptomyces afghaniensis]